MKRESVGSSPRANGLQLQLLDSAPAPSRPRLQAQTYQVAGLFAGIGGIERGLHRGGHETKLLCENDPSAVAVLKKHFSGVPLHTDVRNLEQLPPEVSLLAAGFPCQDLSQAGTTRGIAGARSGLVGEVFRLVEAHRTPLVLLENVPFMLQLAQGRAMDVIAGAFEDLGYSWAYRVVDARAFGLPQRRRRVFFLASNIGDPRSVLFADEAGEMEEPRLNGHAVACGFYWTEGVRGLGWAVNAVPTLKGGSAVGIPSPPAIVLEDGRVVTPSVRDAERLQGFPKDWTKAAERISKKGVRWKLVGNAVSVRAATWLGQRLAHPGELLPFELHTMRDRRHWPCAAWNVGDGRTCVEASEWPVRRAYLPLSSFLTDDPTPLSVKATSGFLARASKSKLKFPAGFIAALELHLQRMQASGLGVNGNKRRTKGSRLASQQHARL